MHRQAERSRDDLLHIGRRLRGGVDFQVIGFGDDERALRFEMDALLLAGFHHAGHDPRE